MLEHDDMVGLALKKLDDLGIADNTVVIYSTDNGAETFTWPGVIEPGTTYKEITSHEDWIPTLMAAAGVPDIVDKLKSGHEANGKTFRVHIDGSGFCPSSRARSRRSLGAPSSTSARLNKVLDSTATQWSFQFSYQNMLSYHQDTLDNGKTRPAGSNDYIQFRIVAPLPFKGVTILPRLTLRLYENAQGQSGLGNTELFALFIPSALDWGSGRAGIRARHRPRQRKSLPGRVGLRFCRSDRQRQRLLVLRAALHPVVAGHRPHRSFRRAGRTPTLSARASRATKGSRLASATSFS